MERYQSKKIIAVIIAVLIGVVSFFGFSKHFSSPETNAKTIEALDESKETVTKVTLASAMTATVLSAAPGDTTTAVANQIAEVGSWLLIAVCMIYLEKFLLAAAGTITFQVLIPLACGFFILFLIGKSNACRRIAVKLAALGLALVLVVPAGVWVGNQMKAMNETTIEQTVEELNEIGSAETEEGLLKGVFSAIKENVLELEESLKQMLNHTIESVAILIIADCVIPIGVFAGLLWFINLLFHIPMGDIKWESPFRKEDKKTKQE